MLACFTGCIFERQLKEVNATIGRVEPCECCITCSDIASMKMVLASSDSCREKLGAEDEAIESFDDSGFVLPACVLLSACEMRIELEFCRLPLVLLL